MKFILNILVSVALLISFSCKSDYTVLSKEITSNIMLASAIDNETGSMIGQGNAFVIMKDGWVEASLDLSTYYKDDENDLLIHLDWVDELGNSFHKKQHLFTNDKPKVNTAISISPELRNAGNYSLNIYVFRELVASKKFELSTMSTYDSAVKETIKLETRVNKKTKKYKIDVPVIHLMNDKWIKASVRFRNKPKTDVKNLLYQLNWIDSKGEVFYKKKFSIPSKKNKSTIDCAVEVAPNKKATGNYKIQLLLFGKLVSEKEFVLKPVLDVKKIKVKAHFDEVLKGVNSQKNRFTIQNGNKVKVTFNLENCLAFGTEEQLNFKISWLGANDKRFYSKRFNFTPKTAKKSITSTISVSPKKRKPGTYQVQLYLFNEVVSKSSFELK